MRLPLSSRSITKTDVIALPRKKCNFLLPAIEKFPRVKSGKKLVAILFSPPKKQVNMRMKVVLVSMAAGM